MFQGQLYMVPLTSTLLIGGCFVLLAWVQIITDWSQGKRPGIALFTFTIAVLLDAIPYSLVGLWTTAHPDQWKIIVPSILYASFAFLVLTVILSWRSSGFVKFGSRLACVIDLPALVLLMFALYRGH
jgi:sorbitol-specific phosphotransferase system component IIBC